MQSRTQTLSIPARFSALPEIMDWLERVAGNLGLDQVKRMQLVIEELFTNSIHYGYCGECDSVITITLVCHAESVNLIYCDDAKPFDLLSAEPLASSPERIGGLGLNLVRALASAIDYRHENGQNRIDLAFHSSKPATRSDTDDSRST